MCFHAFDICEGGECFICKIVLGFEICYGTLNNKKINIHFDFFQTTLFTMIHLVGHLTYPPKLKLLLLWGWGKMPFGGVADMCAG